MSKIWTILLPAFVIFYYVEYSISKPGHGRPKRQDDWASIEKQINDARESAFPKNELITIRNTTWYNFGFQLIDGNDCGYVAYLINRSGHTVTMHVQKNADNDSLLIDPVCIAGLINDQYAVTSAHCSTPPHQFVTQNTIFTVRNGVRSLFNLDEGQRRRVGYYFRHPKYNDTFVTEDIQEVYDRYKFISAYDIAVIKFFSPVNLETGFIEARRLSKAYPRDKQICFSYGWPTAKMTAFDEYERPTVPTRTEVRETMFVVWPKAQCGQLINVLKGLPEKFRYITQPDDITPDAFICTEQIMPCPADPKPVSRPIECRMDTVLLCDDELAAVAMFNIHNDTYIWVPIYKFEEFINKTVEDTRENPLHWTENKTMPPFRCPHKLFRYGKIFQSAATNLQAYLPLFVVFIF